MHDPLVNYNHIIAFGIANERELVQMQEISLKAKQILTEFIKQHGLVLVDFKLEFGRFNNQLYLGE